MRNSITRAPAGPFSMLAPWVPELGENRLRRFLDDTFATEPLGFAPPAEIMETPMEYVCSIELPGLVQKDVEIGFEDGVLSIKGEKRDERNLTEPDKRFFLWERTYGSFRRAFTFAGKVDEAKISATMKDGLLKILLPKTAEEKAKGRKIEIQVK